MEEFLRLLDAALGDALAKGHLRTPTVDDPLRIVDLGCGNAYLTFAAHAHLTGDPAEGGAGCRCACPASTSSSSRQTTTRTWPPSSASTLTSSSAPSTMRSLDRDPDVVLALHACDTATDDALARAVGWEASLVLAAPCCHHDIAAQLRAVAATRALLDAHP